MSDYISREAAKQILSRLLVKDAAECTCNLIDCILPADVEPVQRWIPCSERMPKVCKDTSYLSYIPSFGAVDIADYHPDVDEWTFMGMPITVTHWMPLPEPPEEERNETD
nr:MAG TPA: Protein of unknown function (DUF551) [Caudoviricetes sp.]